MDERRKRGQWLRYGAFALFLVGLQGLLVRTSSGQEGAVPRVGIAGASSAAAVPTPPLELLQGAATCDVCEPEKTEIELVFSAPVDGRRLIDAVEITPAAPLEPTQAGRVRRVRLKGTFAVATRYRVVVPRGFCADEGVCLDRATELEFRTGGGYPMARMPVRNTVLPPGGKVPMRFQHVAEATVTLISLRDGEIGPALALAGGHHWEADPLKELPPVTQARAKRIVIKPEELATPGEYELDPFALVGGDQILVALAAPGTATKVAVYQRAGVGVLTKVGARDGLVWVTDTRTGKPLRGAAVSLYHGSLARWRGVTNGDGLVALPGRDRLRQKDARGPLFALVRAQGQTYVAGTDWTDDLEPWMFDLPYYYYSGQRALRGMVTVERGIYRPGERVHVLGVLRRRLGNGRLAPPVGTATLTVKDPDGAQIGQQAVHLTAYGTLRHDFQLPVHGAVGRYHLQLEKDGVVFHHGFEVGEFRAATFEVTMPRAGAAEIEAGEVVVPIEAKYLYGAPVVGGRAAYQVSTRHHRPYFSGYERFSFGSGGYYQYTTELTSGEIELDDHGRAELRLSVAALPEPRADHERTLDLIVEATVTDAADDTITARTLQRVDRSDVHVGVASNRWVVSPKQGWDLQVVVLGRDGRPIAGEMLEVELERTYYDSVAERGPHGVRYRHSQEQQIVATRSVSSAVQPVDLHFDLPGAGDYEVRVTRVGEPYVASRRVWAYGSEATAPVLNNPRIELKLDRDAYEPGDSATVYAAIPYPESTALLTIERSGVLAAKVLELGSADAAIEFAVADAHLPNAYVGLSVVPRSTAAKAPAAGYPFRAGYAELKVSTRRRRLQVFVEPHAERLEPGDVVRVKVKVRDYRDRPVRAEVTLWAADEGVLMLTGYRTPDPFAPAYAPYELDVASATNLSRWTHYDPDAWLDGGGDATTGVGSALRSRFLNTAHFSRGVVTDAQGEATVSFGLPDNVTRWRVMAVAADTGQRFGSGESRIQTAKPLQVLPSLPRFSTEGDLVDAGLVVHNHTGASGTFQVALEATGGRVLGSRQLQVLVPDGRQRPVSFPVVVGPTGVLELRARVTGSGQDDGFSVTLPVNPSTQGASDILAEGTLSGGTARQVVVPVEARPGTAELEITVSPTILASLGPGIERLLEYPYGCAEQKTSRLIPMAVLGDLIRDLELEGFSQDAHRGRLQSTIAELEKHQNSDGGFGLWVESDSDPWVTAYVLFGWTIAREHDYRISAYRFERGMSYLRGAVGRGALGDGYFGYDGGALTTYVLGRNRISDQGLSVRLYEGRDQLSAFDRGMLATALGGGERQQREWAAELLAGLEATSQGPGVTRVVPETATSHYGFGRDVRSTAMMAHALVAAGRTSDAEPYIRGVLTRRGRDGTWGTTYNNLWSLLALGGYAEANRSSARSGSVVVKLDGKVVATLDVAGHDLAKRFVVPAAALPGPGGAARLELDSPRGVPFEHVVRLRYAPTVDAQPATAHGYTIRRDVFDARTGVPVSSPTVGQLLRIEVTIENQDPRHQVALTDRLPAGFEAVNARLSTAQRAVKSRHDWTWRGVEVRDERVSFFAYHLESGVHDVEYLARASRSGEFVWPAASVVSMYQPDEYARTAIESVVVVR